MTMKKSLRIFLSVMVGGSVMTLSHLGTNPELEGYRSTSPIELTAIFIVVTLCTLRLTHKINLLNKENH